MKPKSKKLSPADEKFIAKFLSDKLDFSTETIIRKNPFSGVSAEVDPIFAASHDFIIRLGDVIWKEAPIKEDNLKKIHPELKASNAIMNFDRARSIARKLNPRAYMDLID